MQFHYHPAALLETRAITRRGSHNDRACLGVLLERRNRIFLGIEPFQPSELLPYRGPSGQNLYELLYDLGSERVYGVFETVSPDFSLLAVDLWSGGFRILLPQNYPDAAARALSRAT